MDQPAIIIFTILPNSLIIIFVMAGIVCCCLRTKIKVSLFMNFNLSFGQRLAVHNRLYDVFVVHNQDCVDNESIVI